MCLQEVVHSPATDLDWLTYRDGDHVVPQRANFFREICRAIPDHIAVFFPAAQGVLWDGETSISSQWGLATFVHKRLTIIAQAQGFVHGIYGSAGYGDHPRSRSAHGLRVWDQSAGQAISVAHMHGLLGPAGKHDMSARTPSYKKPGKFADYMLVNAAIEVHSFDVIRDPEVSDHCPLVLDF